MKDDGGDIWIQLDALAIHTVTQWYVCVCVSMCRLFVLLFLEHRNAHQPPLSLQYSVRYITYFHLPKRKKNLFSLNKHHRHHQQHHLMSKPSLLKLSYFRHFSANCYLQTNDKRTILLLVFFFLKVLFSVVFFSTISVRWYDDVDVDVCVGIHARWWRHLSPNSPKRMETFPMKRNRVCQYCFSFRRLLPLLFGC